MNNFENVFVIADQIQNDLRPVSMELLGAAKELAEKLGVKVQALVMGHNLKDIPQILIERGADEVYIVDQPELKEYTTLTYRRAAISVLNSFEKPPPTVLCGVTTLVRDPVPEISSYF